ncbi:glutamine--tRNA ligase/YqeY domain fusion protein [Buchnera aphidicola]|uniref:Glutamine--tRNA ligase n=1 Tax=Buchnera aphidicola (Cinara cf. splendens/pseudotsugae 3390) TaxID=2518980 RepID=A0A451CXX9_9GAMM|nr:glutamine--tRNA ligase/YqeY domain fusion protein [Buchnera aphidicola]VFP77848.1 Glutamine--tRNA ligase [Buchnera aphidicola (Cinara cf. splendens/pseudotsugae 3390)]
MKPTNNNNFISKIVKYSILKNPKRKIKTRFPPEPNGYLHIGHAKSIYLNNNIANKYNGTCNLRFDDTNPRNENVKYIQAIKKDIKWLGLDWYKAPTYTSNYFNQLYRYAIQLIKKKAAYVDELNANDIKKYRGTLKKTGKNSPFRNRTVKKNLTLFKKMKNGMFPEGSMCLRAKIDMKSSYIILRDPVLYRIIVSEHHQTKKKWCIYPMYDFAHCIADALEGITHSLCTLEFLDNRQLYIWILEKLHFNKIPPKQYEFSKLNLEYTILSKRKIQKLINLKLVSGWKDPRLSTLSGLRKRGYTKNSIKTFCQKVGVTRQQSLIELSLLESCIRKDLNYSSPRRMAVINPIKLIITNIDHNYTEYLDVPNHPNRKEMGHRKILFSREIYIEKEDFCKKSVIDYKGLVLGKKVRLKYAYTIRANQIIKNKNNDILCILCTYYLNTKKTKILPKKSYNIIHWISKKNSTKTQFKLFNVLFTCKNPEKEKNIIQLYNPNSCIIKVGYTESIVDNEDIQHAYQFERIGYFLKLKKKNKYNILVCHRIVSLKNKYKNLIN